MVAIAAWMIVAPRAAAAWTPVAFQPAGVASAVSPPPLRIYLYANADPVGRFDPSGRVTLNDALLTVWNVGVQATIAYPRAALAVRLGFAIINLVAFTTDEQYRFVLLNTGPAAAAEVLVADAFALVSAGAKLIQFAPGYLASQSVFGEVSQMIQSASANIQNKYPGALVGIRGSLARGARFDNATQALAPFNKASWDVDAFVVSDQLAAESQLINGFRSSSMLRSLEDQVGNSLAELPGYRTDQGFTFRVFTTQEWVNKFSKQPFKPLQ